jgi:hypothetical protein
MSYVVIAILFLLVLGAGVTILVMANTKESAPAAAQDEDATATPFSGPDHTPLGDTAQHAGSQDEEGRTVTQSDASERGGTGAPTSGPHAAGRATRGEAEEPAGGRFKRDPIGGEGEGEQTLDVGEVPHPRHG